MPPRAVRAVPSRMAMPIDVARWPPLPAACCLEFFDGLGPTVALHAPAGRSGQGALWPVGRPPAAVLTLRAAAGGCPAHGG